MHSRVTAVTLLALMTMSGPTALAEPPQYTIVEVTGRPLQFWEAHDLGPLGQVVGRSWNTTTGEAFRKGFIWQAGTLTQLEGPPGATRTEARCIDEHGVIYGGYGDARFDPILAKTLPLRWVDGAPIPYANNQSINSATIFGCSPTTGLAVGWAKPFEPGAPGWQGQFGYTNEPAFGNGDPVRAFVWSGNTGEVLTREFGLSDDGVQGVNDAGQAALNLNGFELGGAALYDPRMGVARLPNLGVSLPNAGWATITFAINASGQIVGRCQSTGGLEHPVRWTGGEITDLGVLPGFVEGEARDINDAGVVVGGLAAQNFEFGVAPTAGFVFVDGTMYNLNERVTGSPFVIGNAISVNNAGQILVDDGQSWGSRRYGVLTPSR